MMPLSNPDMDFSPSSSPNFQFLQGPFITRVKHGSTVVLGRAREKENSGGFLTNRGPPTYGAPNV
jgi:hypothetical protein